MVLTIIILGSLVVTVIMVNLYFRYQTVRSVERDISTLPWNQISTEEYIRRSYNYIADRFAKVDRTWLRYPWRNMYYTNIWKMHGRGLPCHMQNNLLQRFLEKRIPKNNFRTVITRAFGKGVYIHFYSRIRLYDRWIDVDVWGKKWGIPFGKNVHNSEIY